MEADEKMFHEFKALLSRYKECAARVKHHLEELRAARTEGRRVILYQEVSIELWDHLRAQEMVKVTRELAQCYINVGQSMFGQTTVVEELNEKIATIKERLEHGKISQ